MILFPTNYKIWYTGEDEQTHYDDVIMTMLASQITSLTVVYSIVYSSVNQRKHQSSASLAFVREIHRGPVNFPHKWPVTRKMFPFDDVIMTTQRCNLPVVTRDASCLIQLATPMASLIARFMGPTWGPSGADRSQVAPCWTHELSYLAIWVGAVRK